MNVTEQKRAEQQREDSERQLRELTDSLPEIVFETDVGGTFTFLNPIGLDTSWVYGSRSQKTADD